MPNTFDAFDRDLRLATAGLEPEQINAALAAFARQELAKVLAAGASPNYERFVNGVPGAPESAVKTPGPIVYEFVNWPIVINAALEELKKRSPRRSGRYMNSFMVLANQVPVADYSTIPGTAEVIIFNPQPYTRKIEVGANGPKGNGKRHFDLSRIALNRRFRTAFRAEIRFLDIKSGIHPMVPYKLKRSRGRRKDTQAGKPISYPSLVINVDANG